MLQQPPHPLELVPVLVRTHAVAVREVRRLNADSVHRGRDEAGLRIVVVRAHPDLHILRFGPAQDRDTVVRLLSVDRCVIADVPYLVEWEGVIDDLELLEAKDVRLERAQPGKDPFVPGLDGVDVPSHDFHGTGQSPSTIR